MNNKEANYYHNSISKSETTIDSEERELENDYKRKIDPDSQRYPYCMVWTPLPLISWFLPFIGHTGICT